jgi:short-subunit dehydrogenase
MHAFLPLLRRSKRGIVNNRSLVVLAALPVIPSYSISTTAAFNAKQSLRALFAGQGVTVHAVVLGPIDKVAANRLQFLHSESRLEQVQIGNGQGSSFE